jgi:hypothetical protein
MGIYSDYLSMNLQFDALTAERKKMLARISELRDGRNIMVYAAAVTKKGDIAIDESDLIPFTDTVSSLDSNKGLDIILETPGGSAETVEKIVRNIRSRFSHIAVIVPRMAMSAGTIFAMAANEILMGEISSLGPIDAQVPFNGRYLPAAAILDGVKEIMDEVVANGGKLNPAYIPILQNINPGVLKDCQTAQDFSMTLVQQWLRDYKFSNWIKHKSDNTCVTTEEKDECAKRIAGDLCKHSKWLTHSRFLGIKELTDIGLEITDYRNNPELNDAISRYFILLTMTFDQTSIYKIYETQESQVIKQIVPSVSMPFPAKIEQNPKPVQDMAQVEYTCPKCKTPIKLQANLRINIPLFDGYAKFPQNNKIICPNCKLESDVSMIRMQIESQTRQKIL